MFETRKARRTAKILRDAAEVIETKGWTKIIELNNKGQVCALGAIKVAANDTRHMGQGYENISAPAQRAVDAAEDQLYRSFADFRIRLTSFNDMLATDSTEVTSLFRKAAEAVEQKK